jgi:hypothetical protein
MRDEWGLGLGSGIRIRSVNVIPDEEKQSGDVDQQLGRQR